jgi:hypothetical protein
MLSRKEDIQLLLDNNQHLYNEIVEIYQNNLLSKEVTPELRLKIKTILEDSKSILDYTAHEIAERLNISSPKIYFPIVETGQSIINFDGCIGRNLPKLKDISSDLYIYLEKLQPYYSENKWLANFSEVLNINKHNFLVAQKRTETTYIKSTHNNGGIVSWNPEAVTFGSGVIINGAPVNPSTQLPVDTVETKVEKEIWVDFLFDLDNSHISAIQLVRELKEKLSSIVADIYQILK